jgi:regulatory protein
VDAGTAELAVAELQSDGLVDDGRFAEAYVRSRLARGVGPIRLARELRERGVAQALIDTFLEPLRDEWAARMEEVRRKRFGAEMPEDYRERMRQARFLEYRGFAPDQIRRRLS